MFKSSDVEVKKIMVGTGSTAVEAEKLMAGTGSSSVMAWSGAVQITLGTGYEARDQFRAELTARGLNYQTVTELPFNIELVGSGSAVAMFNDCWALTTIPEMDTSQVTNMGYMFSNCSSLTSVPDMDTSNVVYATAMFANCYALTSVPTMNAVNMVNVTDMFTGCTALTDGNVVLTNRNPNVDTWNMIGGSGLTREPWDTVYVLLSTVADNVDARDQLRAALSARGLNYATVTKIPFEIELIGRGATRDMFRDCHALTTVPAMDTSQVTHMGDMFSECHALSYVPNMDTSQVTGMRRMFHGCQALTHAPALDTSQVVDSAYMFTNCSSLTYVPYMDTSKNTDLYAMFRYCSSLTDGNVLLSVRRQGANTLRMIEGSGLTKEPFRETVQITLGSLYQARDQMRAALTARGLNYQTVTEIPFNIELVGAGTTREMFENYYALTTAPAMDTSQVTNMRDMFRECRALTYVPDMNTAQVTNMTYMFRGCTVLTDGNVRLFGRHEIVSTANMITASGLTFEPFYASEAEGPGMHEVLVDNVKNSGTDTLLPLAAVRVPAGETWSVRIQGTITKASSGSLSRPSFRIGTTTSGKYAQGAAVDFSGTVTAANSAIAIVLNDYAGTSFFGTVTIDNAVQITLGADLEARDQLRAALTGRGLDHTTVKWIPFDIKLVGTGSARELFRGCAALMLAPDMDTSGVTSTRSMYYDCSSLIRVPGIDTSQVTDSRWMFYNCASLTSAPDLDTAKVTSMYSMYSGCASLTSVPDMGTGNVTDMSYMFSGCTSLTTAPAMGTSKVTDMGSMFNACSSLTSVPAMDTSKVTSMTFMFNGCSSLTSVPAMNTSNATTLRTMFQNCSSLTYIPDLQASNVGDVSYTFNGCSSLTDGNVRLIGKKAGVVADYTISRSGLTRLPFYDTAGNPI